MIWNVLATITNVLGTIGTIVGVTVVILGAIATISRVWSETGKDKLISILKDQNDRLDQDCRHYRQEVHGIRAEAQVVISDAEVKVARMAQSLKEVELRNAQLVAKTDLSPVMETMTNFILEQRAFMEKQTAINNEVLLGLRRLIGD